MCKPKVGKNKISKSPLHLKPPPSAEKKPGKGKVDTPKEAEKKRLAAMNPTLGLQNPPKTPKKDMKGKEAKDANVKKDATNDKKDPKKEVKKDEKVLKNEAPKRDGSKPDNSDIRSVHVKPSHMVRLHQGADCKQSIHAHPVEQPESSDDNNTNLNRDQFNINNVISSKEPLESEASVKKVEPKIEPKVEAISPSTSRKNESVKKARGGSAPEDSDVKEEDSKT